MKRFSFFLLAAFFAGQLRADITLGAPFRDGAVLQRGKPLAVWGTADPGEAIRVEFHGEAESATADDQGRWRVALPALAASETPARLTVSGKTTVAIDNVLVGDVWICSGQSNMFFTVKAVRNAKKEIAAATDSAIREFAPIGPAEKVVGSEFDVLIRDNVAERPKDNIKGAWEVCSPATVARFTAVGYFFARNLRRSLGDVPIGIVKATLGGSPIEAWIGPDRLADDPAFAPVAERWNRLAGKTLNRNQIRERPSGLYNGLIHPLEPMAMKGILWYQGESNAVRWKEYSRLFSTLIREWRTEFDQGDLPFIFVQLPNLADKFVGSGLGAGEQWALQREAQASALKLPNVGMVVTLDIGDVALLHPTNKQDVGRRAALVALDLAYGQSVEDSGPVFTRLERDGSALRLYFTHADGLRIAGDPGRVCEVAGADRHFVAAAARVEGDALVVAAPSVPQPEAVRCEWRNAPEAFLTNSADLPAPPFRSSP